MYIVACPIGNCHHVRGNERGLARLQRAKEILDADRRWAATGWKCSSCPAARAWLLPWQPRP